MRIEDAAELLAEIAATYPVGRLTHLGVDLWPVVRALLWPELTAGRLVPVRREVAPPSPPPSEPPPPHPLLLEPELADDPAAIRFALRSVDEERRRIHHALGLRAPLDLLLLARRDDLVDRVEGKPFDRFIDPLLAFARARGLSAEKLLPGETLGRESALAIPGLVLPIDVERPEMPPSTGSPILENFTATLARRWGIVLDPWALVAQARLVRMRARALWPLLLAARPRAVAFVCYFAAHAFAMTYACRRLGILTCDVQHGKQGMASPYSHWDTIPPGNYNTLPDRFWTWGEPSAAHIRARLARVEGGPEVLVAGNAWSAMWLNGREPHPDPDDEPLLRRAAQAERVILVTLQPISEPWPGHLLDAMARSPVSWLWLVRLHPRMRKDLAAHAARLPFGAPAEIVRSSAAPLYALLRRSHLHLTCWSSVAHEATLLGVPTGILHDQGAALYAAELARGEFRDARDADSILALARDPPQPRAAGRYIDTDDAVIEAGLRALVAS